MSSKQILLRVIPALFLLFLIVFSIKKSVYNKGVDFYENEINAIIIKVERSKITRGTKVYYGDNEDYFYLENYKGVLLKEDDSIIKLGQEIKVYRKDDNDYKFIGRGTSIKPKKDFFTYFIF